MSADKIVMIMTVPTNVLDQSHLAQEASELSKGRLPLDGMLRAKKDVDGLLPLPEDLYAPKPIKVNEAHLTPAKRAELDFAVVAYGDAQAFIRDRNRAEKAITSIGTTYDFTKAALEARKAKAVKAS